MIGIYVLDCWIESENDWDLCFRRDLFDWEIPSWIRLMALLDVTRVGLGGG